MGSSLVWGNIRGFTVTEYVRSRDSGIFRRWWAKVVSPYTYNLLMADLHTEPLITEEIIESAEFCALVVESACT